MKKSFSLAVALSAATLLAGCGSSTTRTQNTVPAPTTPPASSNTAVAYATTLQGILPGQPVNTPGAIVGVQASGSSVSPLPGSPFATPGYTNVLSSGGSLLFALTNNDLSVLTYRVDTSNGTLTKLSTTDVATAQTAGHCCFPIVSDTTGTSLYAFDDSEIDGYQVNQSNGTFTPIPGSPWSTSGSNFAGAVSPHVSPDGKFLCMIDRIDNTKLRCFTRNTAGTLLDFPNGVASPSGATRVFDFAFTPDSSSVLVLTASQLCVFPAPGQNQTGACISAGTTSTAEVAISPSGKFVAVTAFSDNKVLMFSRASSGALTPIGSAATPANPEPVAFSRSEQFLFAGTAVGIASYSFDASTGSLTQLQGSPSPPTGATQGSVVAF